MTKEIEKIDVFKLLTDEIHDHQLLHHWLFRIPFRSSNLTDHFMLFPVSTTFFISDVYTARCL